MCVKCAVEEAVNVGDWDEVVRLAEAEKKANDTKAQADDEAAEAPEADEPVPAEKAVSGKARK